MTLDAQVARLQWSDSPHPIPLTAKFALMNSGIVPASAYERDAALLKALRVESLRIDVGWGAQWIGHDVDVIRSDGFDFEPVDAIARALTDAGVAPYWAYCYVPEPFRADPTSWRSLADDASGWVGMVTEYARGAVARNVQIGYHEVYNEPDLADELTAEKIFFDGDLSQYLELYKATVTAIRSVVPDAKVGGPATGSVHANHHWISALLDYVEAEDLPLDFLSFHHYGRYTASAAWEKVLEIVQDRPRFNDLEIHLNEYNSFPIHYPAGGLQEQLPMAGALLDDFARLLKVPRITRVHWAQFQDSGYGLFCGLLDIYGRPRPAYWAFRWYAELLDKVRVESSSDLDGLGSFVVRTPDGHGYEGIIWNRTGGAVQLSLQPPASGIDGVAISHIVDQTNATPTPLQDNPGRLRLQLPPQAVIRFQTKSEQ